MGLKGRVIIVRTEMSPVSERSEAVSPHSSFPPLPPPEAPSVGSVHPPVDAAVCSEPVSGVSPPAANPEKPKIVLLNL